MAEFSITLTNKRGTTVLTKYDILTHETAGLTFDENLSLSIEGPTLSFAMLKYLYEGSRKVVNTAALSINYGSVIQLIVNSHRYDFAITGINYQFTPENLQLNFDSLNLFQFENQQVGIGYTIVADTTDPQYLGAQPIDWWVNKILDENNVGWEYIDIDTANREILNNLNTTSLNEIRADTSNEEGWLAIEKTEYSTLNAVVSFECSDSNVYNALKQLADNNDLFIVVDYSARNFWFTPKQNPVFNGYYFNPSNNLQSFSLRGKGDNLITVLNVTGPQDLNNQEITLVPSFPDGVLHFIESDQWNVSVFSPDLYNQYTTDPAFLAQAVTVPWLENKLINIDFFTNSFLLPIEKQDIQDLLYNDLRIINGKMIINEKSYLTQYEEDYMMLNQKQIDIDRLHALLYADIDNLFNHVIQWDQLPSPVFIQDVDKTWCAIPNNIDHVKFQFSDNQFVINSNRDSIHNQYIDYDPPYSSGTVPPLPVEYCKIQEGTILEGVHDPQPEIDDETIVIQYQQLESIYFSRPLISMTLNQYPQTANFMQWAAPSTSNRASVQDCKLRLIVMPFIPPVTSGDSVELSNNPSSSSVTTKVEFVFVKNLRTNEYDWVEDDPLSPIQPTPVDPTYFSSSHHYDIYRTGEITKLIELDISQHSNQLRFNQTNLMYQAAASIQIDCTFIASAGSFSFLNPQYIRYETSSDAANIYNQSGKSLYYYYNTVWGEIPQNSSHTFDRNAPVRLTYQPRIAPLHYSVGIKQLPVEIEVWMPRPEGADSWNPTVTTHLTEDTPTLTGFIEAKQYENSLLSDESMTVAGLDERLSEISSKYQSTYELGINGLVHFKQYWEEIGLYYSNYRHVAEIPGSEYIELGAYWYPNTSITTPPQFTLSDINTIKQHFISNKEITRARVIEDCALIASKLTEFWNIARDNLRVSGIYVPETWDCLTNLEKAVSMTEYALFAPLIYGLYRDQRWEVSASLNNNLFPEIFQNLDVKYSFKYYDNNNFIKLPIKEIVSSNTQNYYTECNSYESDKAYYYPELTWSNHVVSDNLKLFKTLIARDTHSYIANIEDFTTAAKILYNFVYTDENQYNLNLDYLNWLTSCVLYDRSNYYVNLQKHNDIWLYLHHNYPGVFRESAYTCESAINSQQLYEAARSELERLSKPSFEYSLTGMDIYAYDRSYLPTNIKLGEQIRIDHQEEMELSNTLNDALREPLYITGISHTLRDDGDYQFTVTTRAANDTMIQRFAQLLNFGR